MRILVSVMVMMTCVGCGGSDPGQVKSWAGAISLVASGTWNVTSGMETDAGNEMENLKCLLMGASGGAKLTEDYSVDDTITVTDSSGGAASVHVMGAVQGSQQYAGGTPDADDHCHAFLNTRTGDWSISIASTSAITGTFTTTTPAGMSSATDSSGGEDFWPLSMVGAYAASGSDGPKSAGALSGMKTFAAPRGSGTITLTWSVSPE